MLLHLAILFLHHSCATADSVSPKSNRVWCGRSRTNSTWTPIPPVPMGRLAAFFSPERQKGKDNERSIKAIKMRSNNTGDAKVKPAVAMKSPSLTDIPLWASNHPSSSVSSLPVTDRTPPAHLNRTPPTADNAGVRSGWTVPRRWVGLLVDEWQFRVESLDSYRRVVRSRLDDSLTRFQTHYEAASGDVRRDMDKQLAKASALQEDYMERIAQQQQRLAELTRSELRSRQQGFNQSLEQFKRQYDDTWGRFSGTVRKLGPFTKAEVAEQQRRLDETFQQFMTQYLNSTAEVRGYIDRMMHISSDVFPRLSMEDDQVRGLVQRLREEEVAKLARLGKAGVRVERARLEGVVERLREQQERMLRHWSHQRGELDATLKRVMEQLLNFNRLYDDLIARKESNLYADSLNDKVLRRVLECLDQGEADGWELVSDAKGVTVHRKNLPSMDGRVSKYCCIKASGTLAASPDDILALFADNTRVPEYNKFYAEGRDLEAINEHTKVVWAASPPMFFFKPRDFCTVVHYRKLQDGTVVVVNRGAEHPEAPRTDKYVRAEILMGANIIQPVPGKPHNAVFTIVTQVDPGGFAPPAIVNKVTSWGPPTFFREVEAAARTTHKIPAPMRVKDAAPSPESPATASTAPSRTSMPNRASRPPPLLPSERARRGM